MNGALIQVSNRTAPNGAKTCLVEDSRGIVLRGRCGNRTTGLQVRDLERQDSGRRYSGAADQEPIPAPWRAPAHALRRPLSKASATAPTHEHAAAPLSAIVRHLAGVDVYPYISGMLDAELDLICAVPDYSVCGAVLLICPVRCILARQIEHAVRVIDRRVAV